MSTYNVTFCQRDYRGERLIWSEVKTDEELNAIVGQLTRRYGNVREAEPGYLVFKSEYQAAHGDMEPCGATIAYDRIEEVEA